MKTLLLILSLLLITTNAYAKWIFYGENVDGTVYLYDKSTVKRNGDKVRVWAYLNYSPDNKDAKSFNTKSTRALEEIDCVNETRKTLSLYSFTEQDLKGDMRELTNPNPIMDYIVPNSTLATLMQLVCKK